MSSPPKASQLWEYPFEAPWPNIVVLLQRPAADASCWEVLDLTRGRVVTVWLREPWRRLL